MRIKSDKGYGYGDTYHQYCERCRKAGIAPESFHTWLRFELDVVLQRGKPGPAPHLDAYQQLQFA